MIDKKIAISPENRKIISYEEAEKRIAQMTEDELIKQAALHDECSSIETLEDHLQDQAKLELIDQAKDILKDIYAKEIFDELADPVKYFVTDNKTYAEDELRGKSFIMLEDGDTPTASEIILKYRGGIHSEADIRAFLQMIYDMDIAYMPDDDFRDIVRFTDHGDTEGVAVFTLEESEALAEIMISCLDYCDANDLDIYQIAGEVQTAEYKKRGMLPENFGVEENEEFAKGGIVKFINNNAEKLIKHYLPDTEPDERFQNSDLRKKGQYVIESQTVRGVKVVDIEVVLDDAYEHADKELNNNYNTFAEFANKMASDAGYEVHILSSDETKSITFEFEDYANSKHARGGTLKKSQMFDINNFEKFAYHYLVDFFKGTDVVVYKNISLTDSKTKKVYRPEIMWKRHDKTSSEVVVIYHHGQDSASVGDFVYQGWDKKFVFDFEELFNKKGEISLKSDGGDVQFNTGGMVNHGFRAGDEIIEIYKGYGIIEWNNNGVIEVINPEQGTRFIVDLDDSKMSGSRTSSGMGYEEQIEAAKEYINHINKVHPLKLELMDNDPEGKGANMRVENYPGGRKYRTPQKKTYTPADLPKDGSLIHVHMPAMGDLKAADVDMVYDKKNFNFKIEQYGKVVGHITEKELLNKLELGDYELPQKKSKGGYTDETNVDTDYNRVIPRDLFNEGKLLKCMGRLCLLIHDDLVPVKMSFDEDVDKFEIGLIDDGSLTIANLPVKIKGIQFLFKTTYNSKANYPLYVQSPDYEEYLVFDEQGEFATEFKDFCENVDKKAKGGKVKKDESLDIDAAMKYFDGFTDKQCKNIKKILTELGPLLTNTYDSFSSGGGFDHVAFKMKDGKWMTFHNVNGDITISRKTYDTPAEFYDAFWEDYENATPYATTTDKEEFEEVSKLVKQIKEKKLVDTYNGDKPMATGGEITDDAHPSKVETIKEVFRATQPEYVAAEAIVNRYHGGGQKDNQHGYAKGGKVNELIYWQVNSSDKSGKEIDSKTFYTFHKQEIAEEFLKQAKALPVGGEVEYGRADEKYAYAPMMFVENKNGELRQAVIKGNKTFWKAFDEIAFTNYNFSVGGSTENTDKYFIDGSKFAEGGELKLQDDVINQGNTPTQLQDQVLEFAKGGKVHNIYDDTPLVPSIISDIVAADQVSANKKMSDLSDEQKHKLQTELSDYLEKRAVTHYRNNEHFRKSMRARGNKGRDSLYSFMHHWSQAWMKEKKYSGGGLACSSKMAFGGEVKVLPEEYYQKFKLKGNGRRLYSIGGSHSDSDYRQASKQLFPGMEYKEHEERAKKYHDIAKDAHDRYDKAVDEAFMKEFGKKPDIGDYKVSGIWRDDFSEEAKESMRKPLYEYSEYSDAMHLHNAMLNKSDKQEKVKYAMGGDFPKPKGIIISTDKAKKIASEWHGGQNSFLYQFGSSGQYVEGDYDDYVKEVNENINRLKLNTTQHAHNRKELIDLRKYFEYKHWEVSDKYEVPDKHADGGKIIGKTKSGKDVYSDFSNPAHKDFTWEDHDDAFDVQRKIIHDDKSISKEATGYHFREGNKHAKARHEKSDAPKYADGGDTGDETKKALDWWNDTLSINEQNAFAKKHLLNYQVSMVVGNSMKYTSASKYKELIHEIWKKETGGDVEDYPIPLKAGPGYWDVTKYPYGGDFKRLKGTEKAKIKKGTVKMGDQIRLELSDGREIIVNYMAMDLPEEKREEVWEEFKKVRTFGNESGGLTGAIEKFSKPIGDNTKTLMKSLKSALPKKKNR